MGFTNDREFFSNPDAWPGGRPGFRQCAVKQANVLGDSRNGLRGPEGFGVVVYSIERKQYALFRRGPDWEIDDSTPHLTTVDDLIRDGWIVD